MLRLNLVSKELREEIKSHHIYILIKKMCMIIIIVSLFVSIILIVSKIILQNNFNRIVDQMTLVTSSTSSYNEKINIINSKINSIKQIQSSYIPFSYLIENLLIIVPENIMYSLIQININDQKLEIRGSAKNRDDLLALKKGLEETGIFTNIESPIQNILQKKDINFQINANININTLKEFINNNNQPNAL